MIPRFPVSDELTIADTRRFSRLLLAVMLVLSACTLPTLSATDFPDTPSPTPAPWTDAADVMSGLCFESVADAAGRTFVIRSAGELTQFYDLADSSDLCRRPVRRASFDFSGGRILAGTWSRAIGCTAHHEVIAIQRDDTARAFVIALRLVIEGDCNYELVRPFWIALDTIPDYDVRLLVE